MTTEAATKAAAFTAAFKKNVEVNQYRPPPRREGLSPQEAAHQSLLVARAELRTAIVASIAAKRDKAARDYFAHAKALVAAFEDMYVASALISNLTGTPDYDMQQLSRVLVVPAPPPDAVPTTLMQDVGSVGKVVPGGHGPAAAEALAARVVALEQQVRSDPALAGAWPFP